MNNNTPVKIVCKNHGVFTQTPRTHIFRKSGCTKCSRASKDEIVNRSNEIHNRKYTYPNFTYDYSNTVSDVMAIECPIHGEFLQRIKTHLTGVGCPYCRESKGEKFIEGILVKNKLIRGVDYFRQYKFEDCKNKKQLPFDFYLPKYKICIEYDGDQHKRVIDFFGGFEQYEIRKSNDEIKNRYCIENGINLLRFSGNDYSSIENDINSIFNLGK